MGMDFLSFYIKSSITLKIFFIFVFYSLNIKASVMNILDIILIICFIPSIIAGMKKGFVSQVVSIIGLLASIWVSSRFAYATGNWLSNYVQTDIAILNLVAFALLMVATCIVFAMIGKILKKMIRVTMLDWLDTILGMVFNVVKVALIVGIIITIFDSLNEKHMFINSSVIDDSLFYGHLRDLVQLTFPYIQKLVLTI